MSDILTARDVAELLRLNERTVLRLAQTGKIPAAKIARRWRFHRDLINNWLEQQMRQMPTEELDRLAGAAPASATDTLDPALISLDLRARRRAEVLRELVELLVQAGQVDSGEALVQSLLRREELMSTALGGGVAIPHPRHPVPELVRRAVCVVGRSGEGISFGALDGERTRLFFLLCAPNDRQHLRLVARLTRLLREQDCVGRLLAAKTAEDLIACIAEREHAMSQERHPKKAVPENAL